MTSFLLKKQVIKKLDSLSFEDQRRVLDFIRNLAMIKSVGVPGQELLPFAGSIKKADLESMRQAIENGCERTDLNEW